MKYNHALFLNPYIESKETSAMKLFPPIGLEYVATNAIGLVGKITLMDLRYEEEYSQADKLLEYINRDVDIICASITWDRHYQEVLDLLKLMPDNLPLVIGGYKATEKADELLRDFPKIDIVVRGEGEETIQEILRGKELKNILGISYRDNGSINHRPNRPMPEVDTIAVPDRRLRNSKYRLMLNGINITDLSFDAVLSARGCPHNCKFCTFSLNPLGQKRNYSARGVKSVVDEIAGLDAKVVLFSDDNLFAYPKRAEELCDLIIARKIRKRFIAQARIELADHPRLLKKMVRAGFKSLLIGIESPHDWILKQLNKGFGSDKVREAFKVFRRYPLLYNGYFIYGNIGESKDEMLQIPKFAKEIGVDVITCNKLRIERFSPLRKLAEETPGYHITDKGELYSDTYSHADLKIIGRKIKFSFYTPTRYMKIMWKAFFVIKFFTFAEIIQFIITAPRLLWSVIAREKKRGRLGDSLKRTFISNK